MEKNTKLMVIELDRDTELELQQIAASEELVFSELVIKIIKEWLQTR